MGDTSKSYRNEWYLEGMELGPGGHITTYTKDVPGGKLYRIYQKGHQVNTIFVPTIHRIGVE